MSLDVASLESVREFVKEFNKKNLPLHILVNNAGVAIEGITKDGFEMRFGTNHLGPYLLTRLLESKLIESAPSRIVIVASVAHTVGWSFPWEDLKKEGTVQETTKYYGFSKLCNIVLAKLLSKRLINKGVSVYSLHPGCIASNIWTNESHKKFADKYFLDEKRGAQTIIYCAAEPSLAKETGEYYEYCKPVAPYNFLAYDPEFEKELWEKSKQFAGLSK